MSPAVAPVSKPDFAWPAGVRAAVSLTFDDARSSQVDVGVPLFDRWGVRATFYMVPSNVEQRLEAWRRAVAAGHEAGGHTLNHPCTCNFGFLSDPARMLENMSLAQIEEEIVGANARLHEQLGVRPTTFAYPCGQKFVGRGEKVQSYVPLVAKHYVVGRGSRDEYFNAPDRCDLAQVAGAEFDGLSFEQVRPAIETAVKTGNWLVLAGHEIAAGAGGQTTLTATLEEICRYCKDPANGIWIDTVAAVGAYVKQRRSC